MPGLDGREGGAAGDGGAAGETGASLTVLESIPIDAATAVERDQVIEVTFSADLDPDTVTVDAFSVDGPMGAVAGKLSVNGAKVSFTADGAWALLAHYTVTLAPTIRSRDGAALAGAYELDFTVRDGAFDKPQRLTTSTTINLSIVGSRTGHVGAIWNDGLTPASALAVLFDPKSGKWTSVAPLESDTQGSYSAVSLAINDLGKAFAVAGFQVGIWNRFNGSTWGTASSNGINESRACSLADDGTAMTVWEDVVENEYRVFVQSLSSQNQWSTTTTLEKAARSADVHRFGTGFIALYTLEADRAFYSRVYDSAAHAWQAAKRITPAGLSASYWSLSTDVAMALFSWSGGSQESAAVFDGKSWVAKELGPVSGGSHTSVGATGSIVSWPYQGKAYAARYDRETGWADPVKLGSISVEEVAPASEVDDTGNALSAWPDGATVAWRRALHGSSSWGEVQYIADQDPSGIWSTSNPSSGEVMLVWSNPLGVWASRFE